MSPAVLELLSAWMPHQRWYGAKGSAPTLAECGFASLGDPPAGVEIVGHIVAATTPAGTDILQVPLTYRDEPLDALAHALIGTVDGRFVYDAPHDPAFVDAALEVLHQPGSAPTPARGRPAAVLSGEQSNTSIIIGADGPEPLMLKLFRALSHGRNPDVEVVGALSAAGCERVPRLYGWLQGVWTAPDGAEASGDLGVATEFLAGSQDAWRVALESATAGRDFTSQAHALGAATATVHRQLSTVFGATSADADTRARVVDGLRRRVAWARSSATAALAPYAEDLDRHLESLSQLEGQAWPALQRVHGDYHLGQVLHSPTRGWVLLDFEGEPLRPLAERTRPDLALRDVVGMLRSFDYAAGHVAVHTPDAAGRARDWADAAEASFIAGYAEVSGNDPTSAADLYRALWLDKALYEVVYEVGNRPGWVDIPLSAVRRGLHA